MSGPRYLAEIALFSVACTRPSPGAFVPPSSTSDDATKIPLEGGTLVDCDGALTLSIDVYFPPHGGSKRLAFESKGRFQFTSSGSERGDSSCSALLKPGEQRAWAAGVDALQLHTLPGSAKVPHVRDGIAIVVKGSCGTSSVDSTTRNIFPAAVGKLTDLVNMLLLSAHCEAGARLPSGADLASWSDSIGATETCALDCGACNSCSP